MEQHGKELKASGWYLSETGLTHCAEQCGEKGWTVTTANLKKIAMDADLRLIGSGALSDDISRNLTSEVSGPIVLQIHRIKNAATPSTKQHNPSPSKRLLRIQLTDGLVHVSAVELDGPLRNFSPTTPPGTKVKLVGKVAVQNGFLLLKQTSLEVLGGTVEALYKKWVSQKSGTDNLERSKGDSGPPNFTPFKASGLSNKISGGERNTGGSSTGQMKKQFNSSTQSRSTEGARGQKTYESKFSSGMSRDSQGGRSRAEEKPRSDRATAAKTHQQERNRRDGREDKLKDQVQSSRYYQEKSGDTSSRGSWRNEEPHYERGRRGRGRGRYQPDLEDYKPPSTDDRFQPKFKETQRSGVYESHDERGRGRRGRGRGRGGRRGRRRGDDDDDGEAYHPSRPSAGHSLGDFFDQKLVLKEKPSYLTKYQDDYYYSDLYYGWEEPYDRGYSYEDSRHRDNPKHKRGGGFTEEYSGTKKGGFTKPWEEYPSMPSRSSHKPTNQRGHKYSGDRGRTGKEEAAWVEEDYPSMPSRPNMKKPMNQPGAGQLGEGGGVGGGEGQGHWDWVGLAAGSSAPSSALKRTTHS